MDEKSYELPLEPKPTPKPSPEPTWPEEVEDTATKQR